MSRETQIWKHSILGVAALLAFLWPWVAAPDVRNTKHNLTRHLPKSADRDGGSVCVFCHAPFGVNGDGPPPAPEWQPSGRPFRGYPTYDDLGRAGRGPTQAVGSQSMACLSCHDAAQAFNVTGFSADHPYGVPYRGVLEGVPHPYLDPKETSPFVFPGHRRPPDRFRPAVSGVIENRQVWWVPETRGSILRSKNDLPLYTREMEDGEIAAFIECSSCHDPHSENREFLRVTNEGSRLCYTCHEE